MRPACCNDVKGAEFHCVACHTSFRGLTLFDAHQNVNYSRQKPIRCRSPLKMRLVQDARGVWCTPEGLEAAGAIRARLAKARAAKATA